LARHFAVPQVEQMLEQHGTLYAAAAVSPDRREYRGRGVAYGIPLGRHRVVVRHSRHGGWLAPLTRDLFLPPTRARLEWSNSFHLIARKVPTPEVVAIAVYRVGALLRRADVVTLEIAGALDLAAHPVTPAAQAAVEVLLVALAKAGAIHRDLNAKNILLADRDGQLTAFVIDIDRLVLGKPSRAADGANRSRLRRSIAKLGLGYRV
jgi:hypothetical protein